jgi:hypothetical protein
MRTSRGHGPTDFQPDSAAARFARRDSEAAAASRAERRLVRMDGVLKLPDGSSVSIKLVDLSYDGCRIETPAELQPGDTVQMIAKGSVTEAAVRWFSDGEAGLSFERAPTRLSRVADPEASSRDEPRITAAFKATMQRHGKVKYPVTVYDMSASGCKVEFVDRPDVGEAVHMRFAGLQPMEGNVRWLAGTQAGIQFERPIHPAVFDLLIRNGGAP